MSSTFDSSLTSPPPPATRYRALNPLAVTCVVLGALSIVTSLHWALSIVPLAAVIVAWIAWKQIRKAPDEWIGASMVRIGAVLAVALWLFGCAFLYFARASEVPYGYERITYEMLQPDPLKPTEPIPDAAVNMQDKKVFVRGYMQSRRTMTGIKEFVLCPAKGDCPFCIPSPAPTEKMRIILQGDLETTYTTHQIGVAGRFRIDPNDPSGIPYAIEADQLR
jgi:hypothetical protein